MNKVFIIAEAGVNHNGSIKKAKELIDAAAASGADAVKFQTFNPVLLITKNAPKAEYQRRATGNKESQFEMLKNLALDIKAHQELMRYSNSKKIMFLSSPFDLESINFLNRLGMKMFKIPSGEITNLPYLRRIGSLKKKIIMSTGMSTLNEIKQALSVLVQAGTKKEKITILHCNTEYPTPIEDVNLLAMLTIKTALKVEVGYSDHTPGIDVPIAAVALGARVIEKHFTLNKNMRGPDHRASLNPCELREMVKAIRNIEKALGSRTKKPSPSEQKNKLCVRRSIVAATNIKKGERFSPENIAVKRPGMGISPMDYDKVIGRTAKKGFVSDDMITS